MHNLDDMIERYRYELLEFSKQNPVHNDEEYRDFVPVMTQQTEKNDRVSENVSDNSQPVEKESQFETNATDDIRITPYANNEDFEMRNGSQGMLRVQVFAADRSFPVSGARVTVEVPFLSGGRELFSGVTDADGIVDNITLPAPSKNLSLDENNTSEPYALYNIRVTHPNYSTGEYNNVPVFDSIKSIQPVALVPMTLVGSQPRDTEFGGVQ
ncbi:MAG: hypothetical protein MJ168_10320 [Clostridia bacterium]|nr:hypothetical protein [Clostridia bacterium]